MVSNVLESQNSFHTSVHPHIHLEIQTDTPMQSMNYAGHCRRRRLRCILDFETLFCLIFQNDITGFNHTTKTYLP